MMVYGHVAGCCCYVWAEQKLRWLLHICTHATHSTERSSEFKMGSVEVLNTRSCCCRVHGQGMQADVSGAAARDQRPCCHPRHAYI